MTLFFVGFVICVWQQIRHDWLVVQWKRWGRISFQKEWQCIQTTAPGLTRTWPGLDQDFAPLSPQDWGEQRNYGYTGPSHYSFPCRMSCWARLPGPPSSTEAVIDSCGCYVSACRAALWVQPINGWCAWPYHPNQLQFIYTVFFLQMH